MIAGNREESIIDINVRHKKEAQEQINGWENELKRAIECNDIEYQKRCKSWIKIWENTLIKLQKEE